VTESDEHSSLLGDRIKTFGRVSSCQASKQTPFLFSFPCRCTPSPLKNKKKQERKNKRAEEKGRERKREREKERKRERKKERKYKVRSKT
jgi:hypothetical protein